MKWDWFAAGHLLAVVFFAWRLSARNDGWRMEKPWRIRDAVRRLPWRERLACLFGKHPRNPHAHVPELAYFVTSCRNGDSEWHEECPRCCRWYRQPLLDQEFAARYRL